MVDKERQTWRDLFKKHKSDITAARQVENYYNIEDDEIKDGSFADGIRKLNTKGALVIPARLTKARAIMLLDFVDEFKRNWYCTHDNDNVGEDNMQFAMQWIVNQINKKWSQNELYSPDKRKVKTN